MAVERVPSEECQGSPCIEEDEVLPTEPEPFVLDEAFEFEAPKFLEFNDDNKWVVKPYVPTRI